MAYTPGAGISYFASGGPLDSDPVSEGAGWIRDLIAFLEDTTAGPQTYNRIPIGSIIINAASNANPNTYLGYGTWTQITDKFLLATGTKALAAAGGAETHTLTTAELPAHTHSINIPVQKNYSSSDGAYCEGAPLDNYGTHVISSESAGSGSAHNNMPPYVCVSMWQRTA